MNYRDAVVMATNGINFFRDEDGEFKCFTNVGTVTMRGGVEISVPERFVIVRGFIRAPRKREIDGETIRVTDKLGVFTAEQEIQNGNQIEVDGERYVVTEARPIRPTGTTIAYRPILRRVALHG